MDITSIIKKEGTSEVKFITNDKLKLFISEIQTIFKAELETTQETQENRNLETILAIQYNIRQYIIENQHRIDFYGQIKLIEGDTKSMPSLFGLYMMVVSKIEKIHTILDVMEQVEKRYLCHMGVKIQSGIDASGVVFQTDDIGIKKVCCCSHKCMLDNMGIIRNSITNCHVVIGCDCIKKNNLIDKDIIKIALQQTEKYLIKKRIADDIKTEKKIIADEKKRIADGIRNEKTQLADEKKTEKERIKRIAEEEKRIEKEKLIKYDYRYYINVRYEVKDDAKEHGARWDNNYKRWYIPPRCKHTYYLKQKYDKPFGL